MIDWERAARQVTTPIRKSRSVGHGIATTLTASINLATADLDGAFEQLQTGDTEVVQEPTEQPYGFATSPSAILRAI